MRDNLVEPARRWRDEGQVSPTANPEQIATVLMTLMPGLLVGRHLVEPVAAGQLIGGLSSLASAFDDARM